MPSDTLVLYCYYEKDAQYQDNLRYFLEKGFKDDLDYVFIVNGFSSVSLPRAANVGVVRRPNTGYDFGAYADALRHLDIERFKYFFFVNTSVRGPFLPPYAKGCWTEPFKELLKGDVKLVGPTINVLDADPSVSSEARAFQQLTGAERPYTHVQTQMFAMDAECMRFLKSKGFFHQEVEQNFVQLIAMREIMMSQMVLKNGWNVACLVPEYRGIDYRKLKKDINPSSNKGDPNFPGACFHRTLHPYEVVFTKHNRGLLPQETESLTRLVLKQRRSVDILVYIVYHDDESMQLAKRFEGLPWAKLHRIDSSKLYESRFFLDLKEREHEWKDKDFVGMITYSAPLKMRVFDIPKLAAKHFTCDVITLSNYHNMPLVLHANYSHPKFHRIWSRLLGTMGFSPKDFLSHDIPCFFNNYWIAKPAWMKRYLAFFDAALDRMERDEELKPLMFSDSGYKGTLPESKLVEIAGVKHYTYHPFVLERLPCFFFWQADAKIYQASPYIDSFHPAFPEEPVRPLIKY
jgi:hypothetical protein